ncbi:hypothetical protein [Henriciella aquimarina]|uniref:hypothetical protein n=1 Tax=Henriciella aquimarina TaxID=545261 RepID=UPI000A051F1A|nr:hypothetical protein [Henriciella aquimarina]
MTVSKTIISALAGLTIMTGAAAAQEVQLTSAEQKTVTDACRVGLPLIPVESDFGHATGDYALPLSEDNGEVHSALIVSETDLRKIPECKAEIDNAIAGREDENADNRVS